MLTIITYKANLKKIIFTNFYIIYHYPHCKTKKDKKDKRLTKSRANDIIWQKGGEEKIFMKRIVIFIFAVLCAAAMAVMPVNAAPQIESGHYEIYILENGNAEITETWVVQFDREQNYTRYYRSYYKNYYNMTDWSAALDGRQMNQLPAVDSARPEYSFAVEMTDAEYIIHLYHDSYDTRRVFTISYTVENAVKIYDDTADFVWDLTGENEASAIGSLTATLTVPKGANPDDFLIWAHGPLHGAFVKDGETKASLRIDNVYSSQIVDIRVNLPPRLFEGGYYIGGNGADEILSYEKKLAADANAIREESERYWREVEKWEEDHPVLSWFRYSGPAEAIYVTLILAGFVFAVVFPLMAKKMLDKKSMPKYIPEQSPEYYRYLPDDIPPAVLNNLLSKFAPGSVSVFKSKGSAFSATMLDLFAEGCLEMHKNAAGDIEIAVNGEKIPELTYEQTLISLITDAAGENTSVTLNEIQRYIKANQGEVYEKKKQFEREVKAEAEKSPYIEEYKRGKSGLGRAYLILLGITVLAGTYLSLYTSAQYMENFSVVGYGVAFVFTGMAGLFCLFISKKGTAASQLGTDKFALWLAFGKFLDDFTTFDKKEFPEFKFWEKYLVYAAALGKSKKLIRELALQYPAENTDDEFIQQGISADLFVSGALLDAIEDIQSKTYSASAPSSDSGGGGGFSSSDGGSGSGSSGSGFD